MRYRTGSGAVIANQRVTLRTEGGDVRVINFQVAEVAKPLASAPREGTALPSMTKTCACERGFTRFRGRWHTTSIPLSGCAGFGVEQTPFNGRHLCMKSRSYVA